MLSSPVGLWWVVHSNAENEHLHSLSFTEAKYPTLPPISKPAKQYKFELVEIIGGYGGLIGIIVGHWCLLGIIGLLEIIVGHWWLSRIIGLLWIFVDYTFVANQLACQFKFEVVEK